MQIKKLLEIIDSALPAQSAADGDKIGLQIHAGGEYAKRVLVAYEIDEDVIDEAAGMKCDCIISFHPLIYYPLQQIQSGDRAGRMCIKLIKHSISLIIIHTNFDVYPEGTSTIFAKKLGLEPQGFLVPSLKYPDRGMGIVARPAMLMNSGELLNLVTSLCYSPLRYCLGKSEKISKIAIVGGSGSSFLDSAIEQECDAFITADITYHKFHQANGKLLLIDPGHYEMEQFVANEIASLIKSLDSEHELESLTVSGNYTNPVRYNPDKYTYSQKKMNYLINNNITV